MNIGKLLIIVGIIFVIIGLIWTFIGRLPGDFSFKVGNVSIHLPIMTSIIISIILTLIFSFFNRFK